MLQIENDRESSGKILFWVGWIKLYPITNYC